MWVIVNICDYIRYICDYIILDQSELKTDSWILKKKTRERS